MARTMPPRDSRDEELDDIPEPQNGAGRSTRPPVTRTARDASPHDDEDDPQPDQRSSRTFPDPTAYAFVGEERQGMLARMRAKLKEIEDSQGAYHKLKDGDNYFRILPSWKGPEHEFYK